MKTPMAPKFTALKNKHEKNAFEKKKRAFEEKKRAGDHSLLPLSTTVGCTGTFYSESTQKHFLFIISQMWYTL